MTCSLSIIAVSGKLTFVHEVPQLVACTKMAPALGLVLSVCVIASLLWTRADWHFPLVTAYSHAAEAQNDSLLVPQQRSILATFKQQVVRDPNGALASWRASRDLCSWNGVVCKADGSDRVVALELPGQGLHGTITPQLFNLPFVTHINLSANSFQGSFPDIAQVGNGSAGASLLSLDLSSNRLSGTLPASIGALSRLQGLLLESNDFSGPIPSALGRCNKLVVLELGTASDGYSRCGINGTIPDTLANCSSLASLRLSHTNLAGPIPAWLGSSVAKLQVLDLSFNQLTGDIPASLGNLTGLVHLDLYDNQGLRGQVPVQLGSCNKLVALFLGMSSDVSGYVRNGIAGTLGTLYDQVLSNMTFLQFLVISGTEMSGSIPGNLATLGGLIQLELRVNRLQGEIPPTMGNLSNVEYVALSFNDFTGSIPREFGLCTRLRGFSVGGLSDLGWTVGTIQIPVRNMDMVGSIPHEMGLLKFLTWFDVRFTSIGGEIPDFSNATGLQSMFLSNNELEGIVTTEHLPASLQVLVAGDNRFTGPISPSFGNLSNLQRLNLQGNSLEGVIPSEIGSCSKLKYLSLGSSYLSGKINITGSIPKEIGQLVALEQFSVQSTQVYGMIPSSLGNCSNMTDLYLNGNELSGSLPTWLSNMTYLQALVVTTNRLNGPLSVVEWNKLESFRFLMLSRNNFSGHIPYSLGMAPKLGYFMASEMELNGNLPLSLRNCSTLRLVDLQSNELGGNISDALDTLADNAYGRRVLAIILTSNRFGGSLPSWIGTRFESLLILVVAGNSIEGFIPQAISSLPMLQQVLEDDPIFRFIGTEIDPPITLTLKNVTTGLFSLSFAMSILDLSNNRLEGVIPMELSHLVGLAYLNLSHNYLSGPIPSTLSNLTSLIEMDVSHNTLSGNIPSTFAGLRRLDYVDFSSNSLVGPIPFGTRYSIASYLGNAGLCGQILNVLCSTPPSPGPKLAPRLGLGTTTFRTFSWTGLWIASGISFLVTLGLFVSKSRGLHFIFGDTEPPEYIVNHGFYQQPGPAHPIVHHPIVRGN